MPWPRRASRTTAPATPATAATTPDTDPALSIMIEYDNDVRAFWNACKTMPGRYIGPFDIWGTEGRIHLTNDYAVLYDDPEEGLRGRELTPTHYSQGHIAGLVTELVGLIREGGEPSCDGRQARTGPGRSSWRRAAIAGRRQRSRAATHHRRLSQRKGRAPENCSRPGNRVGPRS